MDNGEILAMKAGRELDSPVTEEVFGLKVYRYPSRYQTRLPSHNTCRMMKHSTSITAAWRVVEKLEWREFRIFNEYHNGKWYWCCGIEQPEYLGHFFPATAETLPEAICKIALLARLEVKDGR